MVAVAEMGHVAADDGRCYAAVVTEQQRGRVRVQYFLPPGAPVPWPGRWHPHRPGSADIGGFHRIAECPHQPLLP